MRRRQSIRGETAGRAFLALLGLAAAAGTASAAYALVFLVVTLLQPPLWMALLTYFTAAQFAIAAGVMAAGAWRTLREPLGEPGAERTRSEGA